jgi:hypothetical protein
MPSWPVLQKGREHAALNIELYDIEYRLLDQSVVGGFCHLSAHGVFSPSPYADDSHIVFIHHFHCENTGKYSRRVFWHHFASSETSARRCFDAAEFLQQVVPALLPTPSMASSFEP